MENKKTSLASNSLIWFGAGVSIAEILTGTYLAPLGFKTGLTAILIGHAIGCVLLFLSGVIGGSVGKSAMESTKSNFGVIGGLFFALINIMQLIGWTAIMIYDGSLAANQIFGIGAWVWALVIGILIVVWILIGIKNLGKINLVAMSALFTMTIIMSVIIFRGDMPGINLSKDAMTFGAAVELSVAMPLSWLPLISDYTRDAKRPVLASGVSAITYGLVSSWMYVIGMSAAIFTGETDIAIIMLKAGLGVAGLIIVVFSTVTTTFLDAFSAGVSSVSFYKKIDEKKAAIFVAIVGTAMAIIFPMDDITEFLYFIGSVFAPMIAIQITDFFILKREGTESRFDIPNLIVWLAGFLFYRYLMNVDIAFGNTVPDMAATMILCIVVRTIVKKYKKY